MWSTNEHEGSRINQSSFVFIRENSWMFLFCGPDGRRGDVVGGATAGIFAAGAFEAADDFDGHVVVAEDLAAQADAGGGGEASGGHDVFFGLGHRLGFADDELDAAGGAAGVAAAGVELIRSGFVGEGVDE